MRLILNERLRSLECNCYVKMRELKSKIDSEKLEEDGRIEFAVNKLIEARELAFEWQNNRTEINKKEAEEKYIECRRKLNSICNKFFGTASLNKICEWKGD